MRLNYENELNEKKQAVKQKIKDFFLKSRIPFWCIFNYKIMTPGFFNGIKKLFEKLKDEHSC